MKKVKTENIQIILPGTKIQKSNTANPVAFEQLLVDILNGEAPHYNHLGDAETNSINQDSIQENSKLMKRSHNMISSSSLTDVQDNSSTGHDVQIDIQPLKSDEEAVYIAGKTLSEMEFPSEDDQKLVHYQENTLYNPFYIGLQNALPNDNNVLITSKVETVAIENINELNTIKPQHLITSSPEALELTNNVNEHSNTQTESAPTNYLPYHQIQKGENGQEYLSIAGRIKMEIPSEQNNSPLSNGKVNPMKNTIAEALEGVSPEKNQELPQTIFAPEKISSETKEQVRDTINSNYYSPVGSIKTSNEDGLLIHEQQDGCNAKIDYVEDIEARTQIISGSIDNMKSADKLTRTANLGQSVNLNQVENSILSQAPTTLDIHNIKGTLEVNDKGAVKIDGNEINTDFQDNLTTETHEVTQTGIVDPFMKELKITSNEFMMNSLEGEYSNENLQKVNDSIIELIETTSDGDTSVMKVKLYPEELGTVNVILHLEEGKVMAKILVDNESVKQLFQSKLSELNDNLNRQNIQLDEVHIDLNDQGDGSAHRDSNPHQHKNHYVKTRYDLKTTSPELSYGESKSSGSRQISILA